jgi:hypothetical protein
MRNRDVGLLIVGISLFIGFIIWLFNRALSQIVSSSCSHGPACPMWGNIKLQTTIGIAILVFVLSVGIYMIFFAKDIIPIREVHRIKVVKDARVSSSNKKFSLHIKKSLSSLSSEEKIVYNLILNSEGSIFQSEIVKSTGHSKVKITRILDRLEGKGIIERKRRGMTNIILLKHE